SPRQNVEDDAEGPEVRCETPRFPETSDVARSTASVVEPEPWSFETVMTPSPSMLASPDMATPFMSELAPRTQNPPEVGGHVPPIMLTELPPPSHAMEAAPPPEPPRTSVMSCSSP